MLADLIQVPTVLKAATPTIKKDEFHLRDRTRVRGPGPEGAASTLQAGHAGGTRAQLATVVHVARLVRTSAVQMNEGPDLSADPELLQRQFRDHMEDTAATNNKILSKLTSIEGDTHKLVDDSKGIRKSTKDASVHLHNLNVQSILTRNSINFGASTLTRAVEANTDSQRESRELLQQMLRQNEENNLAMWRMNEEMWGRVLQRAYCCRQYPITSSHQYL